jgi:hypothetical protein
MQAISVEPPLKEVPLDRQQEFQQFYQENIGLIYRHVYNQVVISVNTVKRHVYNLCGKLGVLSRLQAIAHARTLNLL